MKLVLLTLTIYFALAASQAHWDKNGAYRVVDEKTLALMEETGPADYSADYFYRKYQPYYPFSYPAYPGSDPVYRAYPAGYPGGYPDGYPAVYPVYPAVNARLALTLKDFRPFVYNYKQVKSQKN